MSCLLWAALRYSSELSEFMRSGLRAVLGNASIWLCHSLQSAPLIS